MGDDLLKTINANKCSIIMVKNSADQLLLDEEPESSITYSIQSGAAITPACDTDLKDNSGDNISYKNSTYSEYTATYWTWKNIKSDYIGWCHYRRRYCYKDEEILNLIDQGYDVIIPKPLMLNPNVREQYKRFHYSIDWDIMMNVLRELSPEYYATAECFFEKTEFYPFNMGIYKREYYNNYCEWLFPILDEIEKRTKKKRDVYQNRYIAFLGERLHSLFFQHNRNNLKYIQSDVIILSSKNKNNSCEKSFNTPLKAISDMLIANQIEESKKYFEENININDTDNKVLQHIYTIYDLEKCNLLESTFFSDFTDTDSLISHFTIIKFFIRRYEFDMEGKEELIDYIKERNVSYIALLYIIKLSSINEVKLLNSIAVDLIDTDIIYAHHLLEYAFNTDSGDNETLYNLALIAFIIADYSKAEKIIESSVEDSERVSDLKRIIKERTDKFE